MIEHLEKQDSFYLDRRFDRGLRGPKVLLINGREHFRFMDFFYLPKAPHDLNTDEIIELCDLRTKYLFQVVDIDLNKSVVACMAGVVKSHMAGQSPSSPLRVLDFGSGPGLSLDLIASYFAETELHGVDISRKAVEAARKTHSNIALIKNKEVLPYESEFFDAVFALFVFHFRIEPLYLSEIRRVLKQSGVFTYNTYNIEPSQLASSLLEAGFDSVDLISGCNLPLNFSAYICTK